MRDLRKPAEYWQDVLKTKAAYIEEDRTDSEDQSLSVEKRHRFGELYIKGAFEFCLARYSAGESLTEISRLGSELIGDTYPTYVEKFPPKMPALNCATRPSYSQMHRKFALLVLSNASRDQSNRFVRAYDRWDYQGLPVPGHRDSIFEAYARRLTGDDRRAAATGVNWPEAYQALSSAIHVHGKERAEALGEFVQRWYRVMASEVTANTELLGPNVTPNQYVGYWCIEAAAASVLFDIDDSTVRDHEHYPTDWADWARSQRLKHG